MAEAVNENSSSVSEKSSQLEVLLHTFGSENKKSGSVLLIVGGSIDIKEAQNLTQFLNKEFHIYAVASEFSEAQLFDYAEHLAEKLEIDKAKRLTVIGIGRGTLLAQALAATAPSLVRRVALVDPYTGTERTLGEKIIRAIERVIPMGIPLRKIRRSFDLRPFVHRLRAPSLVLISPSSSEFLREEAEFFRHHVPNCRVQNLRQPVLTDTGAIGMELSKIFRDFVAVPAKRSQKGGGEE